MKHRRVLLLAELDHDPSAALSAMRRLLPDAELVLIVARLPARKLAWFSAEAPAELNRAAVSALERLRVLAAEAAPSIEVKLAAEWSTEALDELASTQQIDLVVAASLPFRIIHVIAELRKRRSLPVLWVPETTSPADDRGLGEIVCVSIGERSQRALASFLRDHGESGRHVSVLSAGGRLPHDREAALRVVGARAEVKFVAPEIGARRWLDQRISAREIELLVFAHLPASLISSARWPVPSLLLPPITAPRMRQRGMDAPDLIDDGGVLRAVFEYAVGVGRRTSIPDQELAFVSGGRVIATVTTRDGTAQLPAAPFDSYGVFRAGGEVAADPVAAIELGISVVRPGSMPLVLFDAEVGDEELSRLSPLAGKVELLAVRLRPIRSCRSIRERLASAGLDPRVADARLVLDEGPALDIGELMDAVRLARVASRMRSAGFPIAAIVHRSKEPPTTFGFTAVRATEIDARRWSPLPPTLPTSLSARLDAASAALLTTGNRIEVELDNVKARRWLLEAIAGSRTRVHVMSYMAADDDFGRTLETALVEAAARGVEVRVLIDSLHGLHGSLGTTNPLLERLAARAGIELLVSKPIVGVPSLQDLKQRDHRKLVVVDGELALVGGRNLSHEYYTGFDEVALTSHSMWRMVPWLDAGARVEGPAVALLDRTFMEAWTDAGGSSFEIVPAPAVGQTLARVVVHRGLRDASTLEAYLALIETARSHIYVVNGFPLILEIQHALLRALDRGVRVRTLFGHLTPSHAGELFTGPLASARSAATSLVHSRMDALIAAGAEGYQLEIPEQPSWARGLGAVRSHVHAKVMSADGRICAVGSANLDITGGYYESELLLMIEDPSVTRALEARIDELLSGSVRVDRDDPEWRELAKRREWMRQWPGVLSI